MLILMDCFWNHNHDHNHSSDDNRQPNNIYQIKEEIEEVYHISYSAKQLNDLVNFNKRLISKLKKNSVKSLFKGNQINDYSKFIKKQNN